MTTIHEVEHAECQCSYFDVLCSSRAVLQGYGPIKWRLGNDCKGFCLMLQINNKPQGHGVIIYFAK